MTHPQICIIGLAVGFIMLSVSANFVSRDDIENDLGYQMLAMVFGIGGLLAIITSFFSLSIG